MTSSAAKPMDLYIASYNNPDVAQRHWNEVKQLAKDDVIDVDGLLLVKRDKGGKIEVKDDAHDVSHGLKVGAVAGAVLGVIFPPSILGAAAVGALAGTGIGGLRSRGKKHQIKEDAEKVFPENTSGIVVLFNEQSAQQVESALGEADMLTKHEVDGESAESIKMAVASHH